MLELGIMLDLATIIVLITGLLVAVTKLKYLIKKYHDDFEWRKRLQSIQYSGLYHPLIRESKHILQEKFNLYGRYDSIPKDDIIEAMKTDPHIQIHLNNILTYYENICLACRKKVVDEKIMFDMCGKTMYKLRGKLINYIDHHREIANNERLWKEFDEFSIELYSKYYINKTEELNELGR